MDFYVRAFAPVLLLVFVTSGINSAHAATASCVNRYDEVDMSDSDCLTSSCSVSCTSGTGGGGPGVLLGDANSRNPQLPISRHQKVLPRRSTRATYTLDV